MLKLLINPILLTIALIAFYITGSFISGYLGSPQRGGVSWNLTMQELIIMFYLVSLVQHFFIIKIKSNKTKTTLLSSIALIVLSFLIAGNNFTGEGWAHPYRFSFYLACALLLIFIPSIKQLTSKSRPLVGSRWDF